jgi:hypothetical protein
VTTTVSSTTRAPALTGVRRGTDVAFGYLSGLLVLAILLQVFFAGVGIFGHDFGLHKALGNGLEIFAAVVFVAALVARQSWRPIVGSLVLLALVAGAQHALANAGWHDKWIGGLHAFDGMLILLIAVWLAVAAFLRNRT